MTYEDTAGFVAAIEARLRGIEQALRPKEADTGWIILAQDEQEINVWDYEDGYEPIENLCHGEDAPVSLTCMYCPSQSLLVIWSDQAPTAYSATPTQATLRSASAVAENKAKGDRLKRLIKEIRESPMYKQDFPKNG